MKVVDFSTWAARHSYAEIAQSFYRKWDELLHRAVSVEFEKAQVAFYEDHEPSGVFVFTDGAGVFVKDGKTVGRIEMNTPIGLDWLHQKEKYPYSLCFQKKTRGQFFSKNDLICLL